MFAFHSSGEREAETRVGKGAGALSGRNGKMKTFINMLKDQSGASAAEYALILAIIGGAIALAALALGTAVSDSMDRAENCINEPASCEDLGGGGS
jgi:pilus assembly protein Flp/PilA